MFQHSQRGRVPLYFFDCLSVRSAFSKRQDTTLFQHSQSGCHFISVSIYKSGKERLSKLIATQICRLVKSNNKEVPIIALNWKDESTGKQNTVNSLSEQTTTCPISLGWNNPDGPISEDKSLNRVIIHNRKLPVMRLKDFVW